MRQGARRGRSRCNLRGTRACIPPRAGIPAWPSRRGTGALRPPRASGASPPPMAADARCQIASGSSGMKEAHMAAGEYPSHEAISSSENVRGRPSHRLPRQHRRGETPGRTDAWNCGACHRSRKIPCRHGPLAFDLPQKVDHLDGRRGAVESFVARLGARHARLPARSCRWSRCRT